MSQEHDNKGARSRERGAHSGRDESTSQDFQQAVGKLEKQEATLAELREALKEIKPVLDELDSENRRLARLVGEARDRGRVNVDELLAREKLLRKLERLAGD